LLQHIAHFAGRALKLGFVSCENNLMASSPPSWAKLTYNSGFGNSFASEALPGALPVGCNNPQVCAYGLVAEQLSGTAFTAPRAKNQRSWLYRVRPSVVRGPAAPLAHAGLLGAAALVLEPNPLRWAPQPLPTGGATDWLAGLHTVAASGAPDGAPASGLAVHLYACDADMAAREGVFATLRAWKNTF
jgi:homogentisate 1,2-dioxygenase